MKLGHYATAFASLSLFTSTLAAPVVQKQVQTQEQKEAERAKQIARAKNKYFHEPGYVTVPLFLFAKSTSRGLDDLGIVG